MPRIAQSEIVKNVFFDANVHYAQVVVWSASTRQIKNTVAGFHTVGITGVAWSPCGSLLASIGADEFHSLQIIEAFTAQPVFRVR